MRTTLKRKGIFGGNYSVRDVEGRLLMTPICVHVVLTSLQSFNVVMHWSITFRPSSILVLRVRVPLSRHQESRPPAGKGQHRKSMNHQLHVTLRMLRVKSDNSDWLEVRNEFSANAQKIGLDQRSRFYVLTKRSAASEDENGQWHTGKEINIATFFNPTEVAKILLSTKFLCFHAFSLFIYMIIFKYSGWYNSIKAVLT